MHTLAGIHAAAVTPLQEDGSPALSALPELLAFLASRGCHGLLLLGTTGEGPSFSPGERAEILRAGSQVRQAHAQIRLLAGTGTPSLEETIQLTRSAFDLGYDGVVVLPPYYYRSAPEEGLFRYFDLLIRKAVPADGCLLGYHIPGMTGIGFSLDLLSDLRQAHPDRFAGIKDSSHDPQFAQALAARFGSDLLVLTGTDSLLLDGLRSGAAGCITAPANLISPQLRRVWDAFQDGEPADGQQARVTQARHILERYPPFPPLLKPLLHRLHGFPHWPVRPPLVEASAAQVDRSLEDLAACLN